jgi:hypothetical protein
MMSQKKVAFFSGQPNRNSVNALSASSESRKTPPAAANSSMRTDAAFCAFRNADP